MTYSRTSSDSAPPRLARSLRSSPLLPRRRQLLLAASGGALGVTSLVWWKERDHLSDAATASSQVRLVVPAGARATTYPLADGSRVTLAPGSTLTSRGPFGDSSRALHLVGEALFTVARAHAPFVVHAAGIRVQDLSTAFMVRTVAAGGGERARALVSVTQGAVQVSAGAWRDTVREGHALYVVGSGAHQTLGADVARGSVAWTSGALLFTDEPVAAIVERLERWTGLTIDVDAALRGRTVTVTIESESPEGAVQRLAEALGGKAEARNGRWHVSGRAGSPR